MKYALILKLKVFTIILIKDRKYIKNVVYSIYNYKIFIFDFRYTFLRLLQYCIKRNILVRF